MAKGTDYWQCQTVTYCSLTFVGIRFELITRREIEFYDISYQIKITIFKKMNLWAEIWASSLAQNLKTEFIFEKSTNFPKNSHYFFAGLKYLNKINAPEKKGSNQAEHVSCIWWRWSDISKICADSGNLELFQKNQLWSVFRFCWFSTFSNSQTWKWRDRSSEKSGRNWRLINDKQ